VLAAATCSINCRTVPTDAQVRTVLLVLMLLLLLVLLLLLLLLLQLLLVWLLLLLLLTVLTGAQDYDNRGTSICCPESFSSGGCAAFSCCQTSKKLKCALWGNEGIKRCSTVPVRTKSLGSGCPAGQYKVYIRIPPIRNCCELF